MLLGPTTPFPSPIHSERKSKLPFALGKRIGLQIFQFSTLGKAHSIMLSNVKIALHYITVTLKELTGYKG